MSTKKLAQLSFLLVFALFVLLFPSVCKSAIDSGLRLCRTSVLPVLFPFFVFTNLWSEFGLTVELSKKTERAISRLLRLPGCCSSAIVLGYLGGYPIGAQIISSLSEKELITKKQAEHCLMFCNNAGPGFILGIIGNGLFQDIRYGFILLSIHWISALIIGLLFRAKTATNSLPITTVTAPIQSIYSCVTKSVQKAGVITISVCTFIMFFSLFTGFLTHIFSDVLHSPFVSLALGSIELTNGIEMLNTNQSNVIWIFIATAILTGWGGICVHCQTLSILSNLPLSPKSYWIGKLLHAIFSGILAALVAPLLFPQEAILCNRIYLISIIALILACILFMISKKFLWKKGHPSYIIGP